MPSSDTNKLYSFNAGSFTLNLSVEDLLRSKGAITLDFGSSAYLSSESIPEILNDLLIASQNKKGVLDDSNNNAIAIESLKNQISLYESEKKKLIDESMKLVSERNSHLSEIATLKQQTLNLTNIIDDLTKETLKLQSQVKVSQSTPINAATPASIADNSEFEKLKTLYEKLQKEFQILKSQNIEAVTSLKVLEDENEQLMTELDVMKGQMRNLNVSAK